MLASWMSGGRAEQAHDLEDRSPCREQCSVVASVRKQFPKTVARIEIRPCDHPRDGA